MEQSTRLVAGCVGLAVIAVAIGAAGMGVGFWYTTALSVCGGLAAGHFFMMWHLSR